MKKLTDLAEIAATLQTVIDISRRMRSAYTMFPPSSARERRQMENRNTVELAKFEYSGHVYVVAYETRVNVRNVYAHGYYEKDGEKVTLRAITKCLESIKKDLERGC